jgi:hypothetical protein
MSKLVAAPAEPQDVVEDPGHVIEAVSLPPVVISEQAVAFSTAAAAALPRTKPTHSVIAALRAMFQKSSEDAPMAPRHYPPRREAFLEDAAMQREMRRL